MNSILTIIVIGAALLIKLVFKAGSRPYDSVPTEIAPDVEKGSDWGKFFPNDKPYTSESTNSPKTAPKQAKRGEKVNKRTTTLAQHQPISHKSNRGKTANPEAVEDKTIDNSDISGKIIDDFDLRSAVIYSEIMTPKFKDNNDLD